MRSNQLLLFALKLLGVVIIFCSTASAFAIDAATAQKLAETAAREQSLPPGVAEPAIAATVQAMLALPAWAPFYAGAKPNAVTNHWEKDAAAQTESDSISFSTTDTRTKVADFYARSFASRGEVTQLRQEEPWTIEVMSPNQSEVTTLLLEASENNGTNATLSYNKSPATP